MRIDFHGMTIDEAKSKVDQTISQVRASRTSESVEFITGFGTMRPVIFEYLQSYGLYPTYKMGNEGTIIVLVD